MSHQDKIIPQANVVEKIVEKRVPNPLSADPSPALGGDLDAKGHDIQGAGDVQLKTVNGKDIFSWFTGLIATVQDWARGTFAPADHTHSDFQLISEANVKQTQAFITVCASKASVDHSHSLDSLSGELPLSRIENGEAISALLQRDLEDKGHSHEDLEKKFATITVTLAALQSSLAKVADGDTTKSAIDSFGTLVATLTGSLAKLDKKFSDKESEPVELIALRYCLVPEKCNGRRLLQAKGVDMEGKPVEFKITCAGKEIAEGDTVATDQLLITPPNTLVRYLFR